MQRLWKAKIGQTEVNRILNNCYVENLSGSQLTVKAPGNFMKIMSTPLSLEQTLCANSMTGNVGYKGDLRQSLPSK